jgi:hypothetical protein
MRKGERKVKRELGGKRMNICKRTKRWEGKKGSENYEGMKEELKINGEG